MSDQPPVKLYPVPLGAAPRPCRECGKPMVFAPGLKPGTKIPLSISSPLARDDGRGRIVEAPSHFTDCPKPERFSRRTGPPTGRGSGG